MPRITKGMQCPVCMRGTEVLETRSHGGYITRRRACTQDHRFTTREQIVARPVNTSGASGCPSSYRAEPDGQDLNPVSVKDLSASASPATKEQQ